MVEGGEIVRGRGGTAVIAAASALWLGLAAAEARADTRPPRLLNDGSASSGYRAIPVGASRLGEGYRIGGRSPVCLGVTKHRDSVVDPCPGDANAVGPPKPPPAGITPRPPEDPDPLTARLETPPAGLHDGSSAFTVELAFSEEIAASAATLRDSAFLITNGRVTGARPLVAGETRRWEIAVTPDGNADVTIFLPARADCTAAGAVCTADGRSLADSLLVLVQGPPGLSVADAEAVEGEDATLDFLVTLSRAASQSVTVDYATGNGTALAGADYTDTSGTLTFAAGETEMTVSVPVLDDGHDEGTETLTLTLSNASGAGAWIARATARGDIGNTDVMPRALLARLGRTVSAQAVDAIGSRLESSGGTRLVLAGQSVDLTGGATQAGDANAASALDRLARTGGLAGARTLSLRDTLLGSSFRLVAGNREDGAGVTAWGRFSATRFDGQVGGLRTRGTVNSGFAGVDLGGPSLLAGLAVGFSDGTGRYGLDADDDTGKLRAKLTAIYPYARLLLFRRLGLWGLAGYGRGRLKLHRSPLGCASLEEVRHTDIAMRLGAAGLRGEVLTPAKTNGFSLVVRSDAFLMRMDSEEAKARRGNLAASESRVSRIRLVVDGARTFPLGARGALTPTLRIGMRHDDGDAESGIGAEMAGGLRYAIGRIAVEMSARSLLAHGASGYREWGISGHVRIAPGTGGRGVSLTLAPSWGAPQSGVERLWAVSGAGRLAEDGSFAYGHRFRAELGYGFELAGEAGLITPYAGLSSGEHGRRVWHAGTRWRVSPETLLELKGTREEGGDGEPDTRLVLHGRTRW